MNLSIPCSPMKASRAVMRALLQQGALVDWKPSGGAGRRKKSHTSELREPQWNSNRPPGLLLSVLLSQDPDRHLHQVSPTFISSHRNTTDTKSESVRTERERLSTDLRTRSELAVMTLEVQVSTCVSGRSGLNSFLFPVRFETLPRWSVSSRTVLLGCADHRITRSQNKAEHSVNTVTRWVSALSR